MSDAELQEEEREVLLSIYDGDPAFKQLTPTTFQYKYGEDNDAKSFLLEISWGKSYPTEKPTVNMNTFYNKHIVQEVKDRVVKHVDDEIEQWLGSAMTYTLFQSVQEHYAELVSGQPEAIVDINTQVNQLKITEEGQQCEETTKKPKKEHLTKAQKRRQWNRTDGKGEKPRGWDWVDIVKHLSQTGPKQEQES
ncbi:RWD domain-containing protein 4 [Megachile rotundata]|uniref:RWD domain-containing protein 4 n=1 Tax=Megachile rotundata TaxID=143995 RepID=UPI000258E9DC|nr:PREDICTED: RWD domain-containing protein 4 [Megachile rotundata]XP_012144609.1 PREDICTED: RWD domain-containing protein 4 [Megachile rotundata]XP_012144611.1 PREDICTED: RWD domain-containing protein 4 [Megachile rotundata]